MNRPRAPHLPDPAFRDLVHAVKSETRLSEIIGQDITLERQGSCFKGSSPHHEDRTPSFCVWDDSGRYVNYAGGGSESGDVFDYLERYRATPFKEALLELAERSGLGVPEGFVDRQVVARHRERRSVEAILDLAAAYYESRLDEAVRRTWLVDRYGFTEASIAHFRLGFADGGLYAHLTHTHAISRQDALATGLFLERANGSVCDLFQGRITFPYLVGGRVAYMAARLTEHTPDEPWQQNAKYLKLLKRSDKHPYVSPLLRNDTLYNEDVARRRPDCLLVTEGFADVISAHQAGLSAISPATTTFRASDGPRIVELARACGKVVICNDAETSGAGDAGAVTTARLLLDAGVPVRIARLPRPDGCDKVDVNDLVRTQGPEALHQAVRTARPLSQVLIEAVPADTPKADLEVALADALPVIAQASPAEQEAAIDALCSRFSLGARTAKAMIKQAEVSEAAVGADSFQGELYEEDGRYLDRDRRGGARAVSNFVLTPRARINLDDGDDRLLVDARTEDGAHFPGLTFTRSHFTSRAAFQRALPHLDLQWTGSDDHVQGLLRIVSAEEVPHRQGTTVLGLVEGPAGWLWRGPDALLAPTGHGEPPADAVTFIESGATLPQRVAYARAGTPAESRRLAAAVLPDLPRLNRPEVMLPLLGWFFAAPMAAQIRRELRCFPVLNVVGTQGSGKSSTLSDVMLPLVGFIDSDPFDPIQSEFNLLRLLSASNGVPVLIDEYKPSMMPKDAVDRLHRYARMVYKGATATRGHTDLSQDSFAMHAPLILAGESVPDESALMERTVAVRPNKNDLAEGSPLSAVYARLTSLPLHSLAPDIIAFLLARDVAADLAMAQQRVRDSTTGRTLAPRVRTNLVVMVLGLGWFDAFCHHMGVGQETSDWALAVCTVANHLVGADGEVRSALDRFLMSLATLAVRGDLRHGVEFYWKRSGHLALHLPTCFAAHEIHRRKTHATGESVAANDLPRLLREEQDKPEGYVVAVNRPTSWGGRGQTQRAALIDFERLQTRLDIDRFPVDAPTPSSRRQP